jgi:hypothetical protein
MATQLTVFNRACALMGLTPLRSVDDRGEKPDHLRSFWETTVDLCHEATGWDHAKKRAVLAQSGETPSFGYDYYYVLPSDCLRILTLSPTGTAGDDLIEYEGETGKIATNATAVYLTYISDTSRLTVGRWSESFANYVAAELALLCAPKLNSSAVDNITKAVRRAKSDAIGLDATQGPPERRRHGAWSSAGRGFQRNRDREQS